MTDKEKLNSILRLRLFYSTEKELSDLVGYQLKGNHFSRFKPFQCEAYFSKFAEIGREYTQGAVDLSSLLQQYKETSDFYKSYIEHTGHETNKTFLPILLDHVFLGVTSTEETKQTKERLLCERYDKKNKDGNLNIGILLLLTYGLLPTFKNKATQDVIDIIADYQAAYDLLMEIAQANKKFSVVNCSEMLCLKEMRKLIEEEKEGDQYINRLLLIFIVNDALTRIYAERNPARLMQLSKEVVPMDFVLSRFWRNEDDADNVVWEFVPTNTDFWSLYRCEIDYAGKTIRYTHYQILFRNLGYKDFCYTIIMRPAYVYHNILRRELPENAITFDYTDLEYERDGKTVNVMTFTQESPLGVKPMTLKPVKRCDQLRHYETYINHKGVAEEFTDTDNYPEYAVALEEVEVSVSAEAILFNFGKSVYRLDKFDADGNETIAGIDALTHKDNFIYAELTDNCVCRHFLCLDSINQNLDIDELLEKEYFNIITDAMEVFVG